MSDNSYHLSFSSGLSLDPRWPSSEPEDLSIVGHTRFAASYIEAAERAFFDQENVRHPFEFYLGPTIQLTGLAAELTFKTLLRGSGREEKQIKEFGHSTYKAYYEARSLFDEVKFVNMVAYNCEACMPEIVRPWITLVRPACQDPLRRPYPASEQGAPALKKNTCLNRHSAWRVLNKSALRR